MYINKKQLTSKSILKSLFFKENMYTSSSLFLR